MPTLKEYVESSEKAGFYILANAGVEHPVTLQVTRLGETILRETGYQPGETVPSKFVWSMYEVGLSYTSGSESTTQSPQYNIASVTEYSAVANKLSQADRQQLIRLLSEYSGPGEAQVDQLINEIRGANSSQSEREETASDNTNGSIGADVESIDSVVSDDGGS